MLFETYRGQCIDTYINFIKYDKLLRNSYIKLLDTNISAVMFIYALYIKKVTDTQSIYYLNKKLSS